MRKAFTLVEMLIVVVVVVTLMTITFRLGAVNSKNTMRNTTVSRLQRVENCLSGYYAAFGNYPAVKLHGSHNIYLRLAGHGLQDLDAPENDNIWGWDADAFRRGKHQDAEAEAWAQVQAACRAQPVGCEYPFRPECRDFVDAWSQQCIEEAAISTDLTQAQKDILSLGFDDGFSVNIGRFSGYKDRIEWPELQIFKFGLMSFLLPRYLIMVVPDDNYKTLYNSFAQWTGNNSNQANPFSGKKMKWDDVVNDLKKDRDTTDYAKVANIPSQAVCARWMPNLEECVSSALPLTLFGIVVSKGGGGATSPGQTLNRIHTPGGYKENSSSGQYVLDFCTVRDGWWEELYYYSPPPYQTYVLWSSGENRRTFPPWISRETLDSKANRCVGAWIEDDIVNMSH